MHVMRGLGLFATVMVSGACAESIQVLPENPGAENGDTSGWMHADTFSAGNAIPAREGLWYFETTLHEDVFYLERGLTQIVDVRKYEGLIERVEFSTSVAADTGTATHVTDDGIESWTYRSKRGLWFFDQNMESLGAAAWFSFNRGATTWVDGTAVMSEAIDAQWDNYRESIAFIEIRLGGVWKNDRTSIGTLDLPDDAIVDPPSATRFDAVSLALVIPEPSTFLLMVAGTMGLGMRSRER